MTTGKRIKVYRAKDGWRWQLWSSSDIVSESGQGYDDKDFAIEKARENTPADTPLVVEDEVQ